MNIKRIVLFCMVTLIVFFNYKVWAADQTATSCSAAAIQAAIVACDASGGGTVYIPTCDYQSSSPNGALWSSGQKICLSSTHSIKLLGRGIANTRIGVVAGYAAGYGGSCPGASGEAMQSVPIQVAGIGPKEIGQFYLDLQHTTMAIYQNQCPGDPTCANGATNVRFHDIYLYNPGNTGAYSMEIFYNHHSTTVLDHMTFINTTPGNPNPYGPTFISGWNATDNAFRFSPPYGQNDGVFVEDCTFDGLYHPFDGYYSTHITFRHNTLQNNTSGTSGHEAGYTVGSTNPPDLSGPNLTEIYDNTFSNQASAIYFRNGFYIVTDNSAAVQTNFVEALSTAGATRANCTTALGCPYAWTGSSTSTNCYQTERAWVWNNKTSNPITSAANCTRIGYEILQRAPANGDYGFNQSSYTKYTYPHPLVTGQSIGGGSTSTPNPPPSLLLNK